MKSFASVAICLSLCFIGFCHCAANRPEHSVNVSIGLILKHEFFREKVDNLERHFDGFALTNPFHRRSFPDLPSESHELRFRLDKLSPAALLLKEANERRVVYDVSGSPGSTFMAATESLPQPPNVSAATAAAELIIVWRGIQPAQAMCFYLDPADKLYWQGTIPLAPDSVFFATERGVPVIISPRMNFKDQYMFEQEEELSTDRASPPPLLENVIANQAGFAIVIDGLQSWTLSGRMSDANGKMACISNKDPFEKRQDMLHGREQKKLKLHILMAENIREVHRTAVDAGHIARHEAAILPEPVLEYPFWSLNSFAYATENDPVAVNDIPAAVSRFSQYSDRFHLIYDLEERLDPEMRIFNRILNIMRSHCATCRILLNSEAEDGQEVRRRLSRFSNQTDHIGLGFALVQPDPLSEKTLQLKRVDDLLRRYPAFISTHYVQQFLSLNRDLVDDQLPVEPLIIATDGAFKLQTLPLLLQSVTLITDMSYKTVQSDQLKAAVMNAQIAAMAGYQFGQPMLTTTRDNRLSRLPSIELYIRFIQMVTFLPSMLIPVPPWYYPDTEALNVTGLVKDLIQLHRTVALPEIRKGAGAWLSRGEPVIRPVWYAEPEDSPCFGSTIGKLCDLEFMLGPDLIVAPVLDIDAENPQSVHRFYLPRGCWRGGWNGHIYKGHLKHNITSGVDLKLLPYFTRESVTETVC